MIIARFLTGGSARYGVISGDEIRELEGDPITTGDGGRETGKAHRLAEVEKIGTLSNRVVEPA